MHMSFHTHRTGMEGIPCLLGIRTRQMQIRVGPISVEAGDNGGGGNKMVVVVVVVYPFGRPAFIFQEQEKEKKTMNIEGALK